AALAPLIRQWQLDHAARLTVLPVSASTAYRCTGTPSAVLISAEGRIASRLARGPHEIQALVARTLGVTVSASAEPPRAANGRGPRVGDRAPEIALPDSRGTPIDLGERLRGNRTLVVFWDPGCRYCRAMQRDIQRWEGAPSATRPHLLIVVTAAPGRG